MSFGTMTVGELRRQISQKLVNDETLPDSMVSEVTVAVHASYQDLIRESHGEEYLASSCEPITLVEGTSDYELEDDVFQVIDSSFFYDQTPYWPVQIVDARQIDIWRSTTPAILGVPRFAQMNGVDPVSGRFVMKFYPTPSGAANGKTLRYRKITRIPSLWGADDDTELDRRFPETWFHALIAGALTWMPNYTQEMAPVWERKWAEYKIEARRYAWPVRGDSEQHERYRPQGWSSLRPWPQLATWPMRP